ncbi:hypothetical protein F5H01DRAFT_350290 [Linnemannia elongata]|nr:hypothetical protein F5H01DRAFT_350290 [Linnemannia elongata]
MKVYYCTMYLMPCCVFALLYAEEAVVLDQKGGGRSRAYLTCWLDWLAGWLTESGSLCYASRRSGRWFLPAIMAILDPVKNKASPSLLQSCEIPQ